MMSNFKTLLLLLHSAEAQISESITEGTSAYRCRVICVHFACVHKSADQQPPPFAYERISGRCFSANADSLADLGYYVNPDSSRKTCKELQRVYKES
ncbi:hypothetical protein T01_6351 [Trichinella spiralis]|uniref:Secreted protein n=1 Tax=Trichinella spiralis TaxID=6334 RepID=A0A0V1AR42_TRISP|nr:hypothetical protein T01_6351 [Trichinella spiralis]